MKMCECALRRVRGDRLTKRADLIPLHARAAHPGVNREMPRTLRLTPSRDGGRVAQRGREIAANRGVEVTLKDGRENQNRASDTDAAQFFAFADSGDAKTPRVES